MHAGPGRVFNPQPLRHRQPGRPGRTLGLLCLLLALQGCTPPTREPVLSPAGYGEVRFGSTLEAVEQTLGEAAEAMPQVPGGECRYVRFNRYPGVQFMVEHGVVSRADAATGVANSLRIAVGTPLPEVLERYPEGELRPHPYARAGSYLVFRGEAAASALVMEVVDERVAAIRAGLEPAVGYVEGCL